MTLAIQRGELFVHDFDRQARWYLDSAGEGVARGYLVALEDTLRLLAAHPALGRPRRFRHPELRRLRSFRVDPPYQRHLIFYRFDTAILFAVRVIHGARDLPLRLLEPPEG